MGFRHVGSRIAPAWITIVAAASFVALTGADAPLAGAAEYKMLLCAGNVGAGEYTTETNTISDANPGGIFAFEDRCGPAGDPAGNAAFLRIAEDQDSGYAGYSGYGRMVWSAPEGIQIASAGGYTREPNAFNEGWRARYWLEGLDGSIGNVLMQGSGTAQASEVARPVTTIFAPHLWPFAALGSYRRFSFELACVRKGDGCDRSNFNAVDSNTMLLTLIDPSPPAVSVAEGALADGRWVRGAQPISWTTSEEGSGLRFERVRVDGAERWTADLRGLCDIASSEASGEYARSFQPCPRGADFSRSATIDTAPLADGVHTATICAQDLGQAQGLDGTGGESCVSRTIHTDNSAPAAPLGLTIGSADPARYLPTLSASWGLAPDPGSPITKVHWWITDALGNPVVPDQVVEATDPTGLPAISGPGAPGAYTLHVALEDEVGFVGPAATAPIPHDTTAPAAPQDISVTPPEASRFSRGFDVQWTDIVDAGSPISAAHYEITDAAGNVVIGERTVTGELPQAIEHLATPKAPGSYRLRVWLSDAEGNVGAPVSAPLAFDCERSDVKGATSVSATFGAAKRNQILVPYGNGATLAGTLTGAGGAELGGAPVCVFGRIVTSTHRRFLGVAVTNSEGGYVYPVPSGASREIAVENRPGQRTIRSRATLVTRAHPTIELRSKTPVHNRSTALFVGHLPGPDSGGVTIGLQVKDGQGWDVIRQITTSASGNFRITYPVLRSPTPRTYTLRAVMPPQPGVPYHSGGSDPIPLPVRP